MDDNQTQTITDEAAGRYFHYMLNMADDDLDPYEYRLLGHYRRKCGANNNPCTETTRTTAKKIPKFSTAKVCTTRKDLADKGWIRLHEADGQIHVTLIDRMGENVARYAPCSPDEHGQNPTGERSPHEQQRSPGEHMNQHIKNQPSNQPGESITSDASGEVPSGVDSPLVVDDEIKSLVLPEIQKLHLPPGDQEALFARGAEQALAIAWTAQKGHSPGGLAKHLMANGGAADDALARARVAIELRTLDPVPIDEAINQQALSNLSDQVKARAATLAAAVPDESLNHVIDGERTIWQICQASLANLEWDPRINPRDLADFADLHILRFESDTQRLIVRGPARCITTLAGWLQLSARDVTVCAESEAVPA